MPEHEAHARAVYDHTDEEPRGRRRQVADWGVGEELFDHMPRRRFGRERGDRHEDEAIPRGGAEDGRRTIVIGEDDALPPVREEPSEDEAFASREEALRAREEDEALWGGDEPFAAGRDEVVAGGDEPFVAAGDEAVAAGYEAVPPGDEVVAADDEVVARGLVRGAQGGRRTVKIGGRPGEIPVQRRRPPRTVGERVGARPDRVAAWAFALGLLLILIAVATANAAVA